jgi:hypothetical protein
VPYASDAATLLATSLQQTVTVTITGAGFATPYTVELTAGTLSFDETRAPRCQATLTARVPEDAATLAALDPRGNVVVTIVAGYVRPDETVDTMTVAVLQLRKRRVNRPANTLTLECSGAEARILDAGNPIAKFVPTPTTTTTAIVSILTQAWGGVTPAYSSSLTDTTTNAAVPGVQPDQDYWQAIDTYADSVGADVYDNGLGTFIIEKRPTLAASPALALVVGDGGTIVGVDTTIDREGYYNCVVLVYRWVETQYDSTGIPKQVPMLILGRATVTGGARAAGPGNYVTYSEQRNVAVTQAAANAAAGAVLARFASRGRSLSLSAISAYWLRPGMTVTAQLPTSALETHLCASVAFDLTAGRMALTTRRPESDDTITQGA